MLEKASAEKIAKLRLMPGMEITGLIIATCEPGTVVRVTTASGNRYLFEVTDPAAYRAHVVRCDSRGPDSSGYRGEKFISPIFQIKDQIFHWATTDRSSGTSNTSPVAGITILQTK